MRHGQGENNVSGFELRPEEAKLTDKGRLQAQFIAERVLKLPVDILISSMVPRALQTAEVISQKLGLPVESSALFVERRRPTEQIGIGGKEHKAIDEAVEEHYLIPGSRFSDEENFEDLKNRAKEALGFLEQKQEKHIVVVTHGYFLCALMAYVLFGENLTGHEFKQCVRTFHVENTGLTIFGYDETKAEPWWLWVWNDHAHLAE